MKVFFFLGGGGGIKASFRNGYTTILIRNCCTFYAKCVLISHVVITVLAYTYDELAMSLVA